MTAPIPPLTLWLGAAGLLPFLGLAGGVLAGAEWAPALAAYGATILAFLGAVHWGLALAAPAGESQAAAGRLALGVMPALIGWVALLLPLRPGLALLAGAILATAAVESWAARRGLVPPAYLRLRWALSLVAGACLMLAAVALR
ncbi:DUF3429 domain-containing protein [Falsiroseomonas tokyonensis]|uniref:DUF3429 domain-containing protein n=1 Tax=Falsiroseomonas tokyonensis TaxID=430521 RepID=A0ABV7BRB9_9PROT|nr:DUF3429 domain-containing protein [Falsiroseomonas tokyonensis]MBU8538163.1 DUF3429 domain-containing protein [Falsiroseomonas tokyonensis]